MIVRQLDEILGTAREVEGGNWTSRRLVLADDNVDFSFHDTLIRAGTETRIWYKHHYESVYCIEGRGEIETLSDGTKHPIRPGTLYVLDKHDEHFLRAFEDLRLMCVFSPALTGREVHDEEGAYPLLEPARPRALRRRNIFVIGLNEFNLHELQSIRNAENYEFLRLLDPEDVLERQEYHLDELLEKARKQLSLFPGAPDALVHYIDFPVSTMVPILCREFGLPSASLDAVLKCEHKFWSRVEQAKCVPEHIPAFRAFDPFDDEALAKLGMDFPFWVKPVKSFSSYLGFRIKNESDWERAIAEIRANIGRFAGPFDQLLERVELPAEVAEVGGGMCVAEGIIGGRQCTQEGFVHKGKVKAYATVDSIREPNGSSFSRYQYPSGLPTSVRKRMSRITERFLTHIGYDNAPFNIEFFWDANEDRIWLLEVNTRISESHCDLFEKVDGASHHEVAVDLSLGHRPRLPYRDGEFAHAAKFFVRSYRDAMVTRVPGQTEIERLQREIPGTLVKILPRPGMRLSDMMDQDSYSYTLAILWIGAATTNQLQKRYEKALDILRFEFAD
jgi:quercetin dioxygenase-like cupin family protein